MAVLLIATCFTVNVGAAAAGEVLIEDKTGAVADLAAAQEILSQATEQAGFIVAVYITKAKTDTTKEKMTDRAARYYAKTYGDRPGVMLYINSGTQDVLIYTCGELNGMRYDDIADAMNRFVRYDMVVEFFANRTVRYSRIHPAHTTDTKPASLESTSKPAAAPAKPSKPPLPDEVWRGIVIVGLAALTIIGRKVRRAGERKIFAAIGERLSKGRGEDPPPT